LCLYGSLNSAKIWILALQLTNGQNLRVDSFHLQRAEQADALRHLGSRR
jgi:hypothetical protein